MHSAFNLLFFHNSMFSPFFLYERAKCSRHLKITIIIMIIIICPSVDHLSVLKSMIFKCYSSEELIALNTLHEAAHSNGSTFLMW